ncbi:hypothetical protein DLH72_02240 [Candidatus Gracilibacteria bacterium]|nr:MAG: hypothetical protein DLH72_02240 [Candidatus Gracilibacteria bacterium]
MKKTASGGSAAFIKGCEKKTLGVKISGTGKYQGKGDKTGQENDFTDLSQDEIRKNIHKNASDLIRNRNGNIDKKVNQVYFNNKTTKFSDINSILENGDTVIIKEGNFIIDENVDKQIGIIVMKEGYNVLPETLNGGNIIVTKDVSNINAYIYADGAIMSKDINGNYYKDEDLSIPLVINGSVFSRNTIGGAVAGTGENKYILPGGKKTNDFKLAEKYDLNYLRKSILCGDEDFSLKINYNSGIQTNPPKGFTIQ